MSLHSDGAGSETEERRQRDAQSPRPEQDSAQNGDANPETPPPQQPVILNIAFQNVAGSFITFRMKPTTKFKKAKAAYAEKVRLAPRTLRYLFEGNRVTDDHTPEELEMVDEDIVEVYTEQLGGGSV